MAAGVYNTEALVSAVRLRGMLPSTDDGTSFPRDSDIISLVNQEMVAMLVPWLLRAREGHLLTNTTTPTVAGQASYTLPSRSIASEVAYVQLVDSSGNPIYPGLVETDLEVAVQYPYSQAVFGQPTKYFFQGNQFTLVPAPADSSLSLRCYYAQRPNQLVPSTSVATISTIGSNTVTVASLPTTAAFTSSGTYEVVHANPGFEIVALGVPTGLSGTTFTFSGSIPSTVNVGDSLCLQDTANYPTGIPADIYLGMFATWVALKLAQIKRDQAGAEALEASFKAAEKFCREFTGRRESLGHRKISAAGNRGFGRRPLWFVK